MELELPYGPWSRLASGEWGGFPVSLYLNADKIVMLVLYEKHGDEVSGMLVALKKVFVTDLDLTKTLQTQRREMTSIQKTSLEGSTRFLVVGATPNYSRYSQEALVEAIGKQMSELKTLTQFTLDLAQAYKTSARELKNSEEEQVQQLLGDPFLLFAIYNPQAIKPEQARSSAKAIVGLDGRGEPAELPLNALSAAVVLGSERRERLHAMHLLCEAALTNNVPCLLFDSSNAFAGLAKPNKDSRGFTQHQMTAMPLGFPFQHFELGRGLYIDLSVVPRGAFLQAMGLQETEVGRLLDKALSQGGANSIPQLADQVRLLKDSKEATQYLVNKCLRCLKVIEAKYPAVFAKNPPSDVLIPWHEGIGKVFHVSTKGVPPGLQYLLVSTLLRLIPFPRGKSIKLVVGFDADLNEVYTDALDLVAELREKSAGFVLQAEHELDVDSLQNPSLRMEMVGGQAVALREGEKPLRFTPRPAYTECGEAVQALAGA